MFNLSEIVLADELWTPIYYIILMNLNKKAGIEWNTRLEFGHIFHKTLLYPVSGTI